MTDARRGRPRSTRARSAILEATRELLHADGYEGVSVDGIAARAGVGKQTLYRWWGSKAAVVVDAVLDGGVPVQPVEPFAAASTGDVAADLRAIVESLVDRMTAPEGAPLVRAFVVAASTDAATADALWDRFTEPNRRAVADRLGLGIEAGQIRPDVDRDVIASTIIGSVLFVVLARREDRPGRQPDHAAGLVDLVLNGIVV